MSASSTGLEDELARVEETLPAPTPDALRAPALSGADGAILDDAILEEVDEYFEAGAEVRPGDVVLDVGANVGAFAMRAAERVGGALTVHCFEPAPSTYRALEENLRSHPALRRATTTSHCLALTRSEDAGQERDFFHFTRIPTNSTYDLADKRAEYEAYFDGKARKAAVVLARVVPGIGTALGRALRALIGWAVHRDNRVGVWLADLFTGLSVVRCRTESIETWARAHGVSRVDVLKVDVEGAELDVLDGCGAMWPSIRCVAVETHARGGRDAEVVARLEARGFTSIRRFVPRITERTGLDNVLFVAHRGDTRRDAGGDEVGA